MNQRMLDGCLKHPDVSARYAPVKDGAEGSVACSGFLDEMSKF